MAKCTLYLLRHGQEERSYRVENPDDEQQGPLTEIGRIQAAHTAERLVPIPFTHIHVSTMLRAVQTAAPIIATHADAFYEEIDLIREVVPSIPARYADYFSYITPELASHFAERISDTYRRFFRAPSHAEEHRLLVCHGNLIRALVGRHIGAGQESWMTMSLHNASLTTLEFGMDYPDALITFNDTCHLSSELKTFL
jgi:broad specificity phosphatase PhoE